MILQEGTSIDKVTNNAHRAKADRKSIKNITKEYVISFFSSLSVSFQLSLLAEHNRESIGKAKMKFERLQPPESQNNIYKVGFGAER